MLTIVALFASVFVYFSCFWSIKFENLDLEEEEF